MRNKDRYSILWRDVIRPSILKRDNYKCTSCGAKHHSIGYRNPLGQWVECDSFMLEWCSNNGIKVKRLYLQVAHIDNNPSNNDHSNLTSKCPRCHLLLDANLRHIKRISK